MKKAGSFPRHAAALCLAVLLLVSVGCGNPSQSQTDGNAVGITLTPLEEPVPLAEPEAIAFYAAKSNVSVKEILASGKSGRLDHALPVTLSFTVDSGQSLPTTLSYGLMKGKTKEKGKSVFLPAGTTSCDITDLLPGKTYWYSVAAAVSDGDNLFAEATFTTAASPRILTVEGTKNMRDIGGWKTTDGKTVAYGKLIRGGAIDGYAADDVDPTTITATEEGLRYMKDELGIRFDCDLRDVLVNNDPGPLGEDVPRRGYAAWSYDQAIDKEYGRMKMAEVFHDLAKPEHYPLYLHCTHGADRTGTVCFILEAMLGLSYTDCVREYEYTALYNRSLSRESASLKALVTALGKCGGATVQENAVNYLRSIGITMNEMDTIRSVFLED